MKMTLALPLLCGLWLALPVCAGQTYFNSSGGQLNVGWQDKDGKVQQLTYRLEAGKLPPLIAYRSARMQEDVLQSLLQQGVAEFPAVQFSLSRPEMELRLKGRQPEQVAKAMSWLTQQRDKQEAAWLKLHYFQPFTAPDGAAAIKQDHVRIALESRSELAPLAEQLKQQGSTETEARQKTTAQISTSCRPSPINCSTASRAARARAFSAPARYWSKIRATATAR